MRDPAFSAWIEKAQGARVLDALGHVAPGHGLSAKTRWVGPCPGCGGVDRFSINLKKNVWWCRKAQVGGDAIALAEHVLGCDFLAAVEAINNEPPPGRSISHEEREARAKQLDDMRRRRAEDDERRAIEHNEFRDREIRRAHDIWRDAGPISGSMAEQYLRYRGVSPPAGAKLRAASKLPYWHNIKGKWTVIHEGPAMISAIVGRDGRFCGVHCTWVDPALASNSGKAEIVHPETGELLDAKKVRGSQKGGHIHLGGPVDAARLVLGEGIETVLTVREVETARGVSSTLYWSSVNLGNIGGRALEPVFHPLATMTDKAGRVRRQKVPGPLPARDDLDCLMPPETATEIILLGDGDSDRFATGNCLKRFAARWARPGRTIKAAWADDGRDFNDMLRGAA